MFFRGFQFTPVSSSTSGWESFFSSSWMILKPFKERIYVDTPLMAYSLCIDKLWVSVLIAVHWTRKLLWRCLRDALSGFEQMFETKPAFVRRYRGLLVLKFFKRIFFSVDILLIERVMSVILPMCTFNPSLKYNLYNLVRFNFKFVSVRVCMRGGGDVEEWTQCLEHAACPI